MRQKALLAFFCLMAVFFVARAQESRLTLNLNNVSLGQVFDLIQKQSSYVIFYKDNQVNLQQKVSIKATNQLVEDILRQALAKTNLKFRISDRQIILFKDKNARREYEQLILTEATRSTTIIGRATDEEGNALAGVSVVVKDTPIGVTTNLEGIYSLDIPEDAELLTFSFVGMKKVEVPIDGRDEIDVTLLPEDYSVDEVVVSALGIRRADKALPYATQHIAFDNISNTQRLNFMTGLSGKISGIEILRSASGAGGSTKVMLRGNKSLSMPSEPLFVIDGIPMANNKGDQIGIFGGSDQGDGLSQINANDIESMSILKGANASILYGSQGANGIVLITTKKGDKGPLQASFSSSLLFEQVQKTPDLQFEYGGIGNSKESWSETKGSGRSGNFVNNFFNTGVAKTNTITLGGGGQHTTAYFLFSNTSANGVIPQNEYKKTNLTFKQSTKMLSNQLELSSNVMLADEIIYNKNTAGYYLNPLTGLYLFPRDRNFAEYAQAYQVFDPSRNMYLQNWFVKDHFQSNPYWIVNNQKKEDHIKRVIANVMADLQIGDNFTFKLRGSYDHAERTYEQKNRAGSNETNVHRNGSWKFQKIADDMFYLDAILTYAHSIDDFRFVFLAGSSYLESKAGVGYYVNTGNDGLLYPNEFSFQNIEHNVIVNSCFGSNLIKEGVFGNLLLSYKEKVFLDLAGRNDWASTLYGTGNDSYFYPALGISILPGEFFSLPAALSFGKIRASYSIVANEVPFNSVNPGNNIVQDGGIQKNTTKPFINLKPERVRSFELGTDWRLWKGKMGFGFTYYNIKSTSQFISLPAPSGSGYTRYFVNSGELVNTGIELSAYVNLINKKDFKWTSDLNLSTNKNTIVSLHPELKSPVVLSEVDGYQFVIKEGGSFGDIYGHKFMRDGHGRIIIDEKGDILKSKDPEYLGKSNPRLIIGLSNQLIYKNFSLSFLASGKFGGKVIGQTEAILDGYGVSKRTADARNQRGVAINAVMPDGTTVTRVDAMKYYKTVGDRDGIKEPYVYNRANIRLSELSLSYMWKFNYTAIKQATLSLTGQNLFFFYKDAPFDPEITLNTQIIDQSIENFSLPPTRIFGINLKVSF